MTSYIDAQVHDTSPTRIERMKEASANKFETGRSCDFSHAWQLAVADASTDRMRFVARYMCVSRPLRFTFFGRRSCMPSATATAGSGAAGGGCRAKQTAQTVEHTATTAAASRCRWS